MCPPMQCPYVLLRHIDDRPRRSRGPGGAWLPHSILPCIALEEEAQVHCWGCLEEKNRYSGSGWDPPRTWKGFPVPTGYEDVP